MTKHHFSIQEGLCFGWAKAKQHAWFIVLTFIISSIIMGAVRGTPFLGFVVGVMTILSIASVSLSIVRGHHFSFSDLFTPVLSCNKVLKFFALTVLFSFPFLAVLLSRQIFMMGNQLNSASVASLGMALMFVFFVVAVYVGVRFKFFPFIVIEHENASLHELLRMCLKLTAGNFWRIFLFLLSFGLLNAAVIVVCNILLFLRLPNIASIFFLVGIVGTVSVTVFATARVYNELKNHHSL